MVGRWRPGRRNGEPRLGLVLLLVLAVALYWALAARERVEAGAIAARFARQNPSATLPASLRSPARRRWQGGRASIDVNCALRAENATGDACTVCGLSGLSSGSPPWREWISLEGTRVAASSDADSVPVYASRIPDGAAVLAANNSDTPVDATLAIHLSRGVYTVERLALDTKNSETAPQLDRLQSIVAGAPCTVHKPVTLAPQTAAIVRWTNQSARTQAEYDSVRECVRPLIHARPTEFRRLMGPLRECEANVAALSNGIRPDRRDDALKHIHRAILTVSHAQALCRNYRGQGRIPGPEADALDSALVRLESALTELSAASLELVPGIVVRPPKQPGDPSIVEMRISNAGSRPVSLVRLGVTPPAGCTVSPSDMTMFDSLRPGETAKATFSLRGSDAIDVRSITGDISWFAARAPAHLRLHTL